MGSTPRLRVIRLNGTQSLFGYGATMDTEIITDLSDNYLKALEILQRAEPGFHHDFQARLQSALQKLVSLQISPSGRIQEWIEDFQEVEVRHRHLSHRYALYPDNIISATVFDLAFVFVHDSE